MHGPAELLPISSSAHVSIVPWLLGWSYDELDSADRKSFEVALHAGTAVALVLRRARAGTPGTSRPPLRLLALACLPPAIAGYAFEGTIERRLSTPRAVAGGLLAGSMMMALGDRAPQRRSIDQAQVPDGLSLGLAQAAALLPGVSRRAATESVARLRGFRRPDAAELSRVVGLPVIAGAAGLRAARLLERRLDRSLRTGFVLGAGAAFGSTLAAGRWFDAAASDGSPLPWAGYRLALAGAIAARIRRDSKARHRGRARP